MLVPTVERSDIVNVVDLLVTVTITDDNRSDPVFEVAPMAITGMAVEFS